MPIDLSAWQCIGLLFVAAVGVMALVVIPPFIVSGRLSQAGERDEAMRRLRDSSESKNHADLE